MAVDQRAHAAIAMGHLERKKVETRRRILAAARHHFSATTFEATSMQEIASDAGVAVGTLYGYFRDKVAIAEALSSEDLAQVTEQALATVPESDVGKQLLHVFSAFFEHHRADVNLTRVVVKELSMAQDSDSPLREQRFMALFTALSGLVAEAQARDELSEHFPPFDIAVNAFALYYFYLVGWLSSQSGFDPPEPHLEQALQLLLHGLR